MNACRLFIMSSLVTICAVTLPSTVVDAQTTAIRHVPTVSPVVSRKNVTKWLDANPDLRTGFKTEKGLSFGPTVVVRNGIQMLVTSPDGKKDLVKVEGPGVVYFDKGTLGVLLGAAIDIGKSLLGLLPGSGGKGGGGGGSSSSNSGGNCTVIFQKSVTIIINGNGSGNTGISACGPAQ